MAQKPLGKAGKKVGGKQQAANMHGKAGKKTKKGAMAKTPKRPALKKAAAEAMELTRSINADNESHFAGVAATAVGAGGKLSILKAPVTSTADQRGKAAKAKTKVPLRPGQAYGAGRG